MRRVFSFLMAAVLALSLGACGKSAQTPPSSKISSTSKTQITGSLLEVAPPSAIQQLSQSLAIYQPQVSIISPQNDAVLQDTSLTVQLTVQDLPIFQDPDLGMGPHLEVILDNNPYTMVYDLKQPLVFSDLAPGTHTLRVVAATPWHESFKNDGAYAQTTFHVFTKTSDNNPDPALPLLTYIRPTGSYGAQPILLDFYLTNAPLHLVAQENPDDNIADWRIRATVNGESFILDRWGSVYLKGFKPGKNWVQLEYLDEQGNPVKNVFNNTVRLIDYQPKGKDTLSKLVRGELTSVQARGIVEQGGIPAAPAIVPAQTEPEATETEPEPVTPTPEVTPNPTPSTETETTPSTPEVQIQPKAEPPKSGGFFGRFRRQSETSPAPEVVPETQVIETPSQVPTEDLPSSDIAPVPEVEVLPPTPDTETQPKAEPPKSGGFFGRFRRQPETSPAPKLPEELAVPSPSTPEVVPPQASEALEEPVSTPEVVPPQASETLEEPVVPETPTPQTSEPDVQPPSQPKETPKLDLKEVLLAPPTIPPKIIVAPKAQEEIPERFLKKAPVEKEQESLEILEPLQDETIVPEQEAPKIMPVP